MNLFFPPEHNRGSKAHWVLDAFKIAHPDAKSWIGQAQWDPRTTGVYWSLGFVYGPNIRRSKREGAPYIFTDMPYWNRWMGDNRDACHWRIIPNALHCNWIEDKPADRFQQLDIKINAWRKSGDHILVCPSSVSMENFHEIVGWTNRTVEQLKRYTDRPIKIRIKPRKLNRSGPMVADIPFAEDCKNAWAVVTSFSLAGIEAATLGVPVFCHPEGPCAQLGNTDISNIEDPVLADREGWVNTLAYYQYTEDEIRRGVHRDVIRSLL
jgi:hypothetical protein